MEKVNDKLIAIYYKVGYNLQTTNLTNEEWDYVLNNKFHCVVTEKTKNNGYERDKKQVLKHLKIGRKYTLDAMNVGQSSSTLVLKEFPRMTWNTVNFEIYKADEA